MKITYIVRACGVSGKINYHVTSLCGGSKKELFKATSYLALIRMLKAEVKHKRTVGFNNIKFSCGKGCEMVEEDVFSYAY